MNLGNLLVDGSSAIEALVADIVAVVKDGGGLAAEGVDLVEKVLADAKFKSSLAALIADLKA